MRNMSKATRPAPTEITSGQLGAAIRADQRRIWEAVRRGSEIFTKGLYYTPGGHMRWKPAAAAAIVRELKLVPPKAWEEAQGPGLAKATGRKGTR